MSQERKILEEMNERSREVFRCVVEAYLETGDPIGSRTLTRSLNEKVSAATIRNVMQDLEYLGLLDSPHISAGRMPTQLGLRMFVDGLMEMSVLDSNERMQIDASMGGNDTDVNTMLDRVGDVLSDLTHGASLVLAPKSDNAISHIEFVSLSDDRALVVLVFDNGHVENRVFVPPAGQTPSAMREAANFLNAIGRGRPLAELRSSIQTEIEKHRNELDELATRLAEAGLATWNDSDGGDERLYVRGTANLLDQQANKPDIERIKKLFDDLERKRDIADFLSLTEQGEGVRIFIGSENKLFSLTGSSLVVSPYMNADRKIVGAVGVIGPTRLNYGRIVPIVDYTAQLVSRVLTGRNQRN